MKLRLIFLVGVPSALLARPLRGIASAERGSRSGVFQAGILGYLDRLHPGGLGFGFCRLGLSVHLGLLSRWSICLPGSRRFGPRFLGLLLPLARRRSSGFGPYLIAGLTNPGQSDLAAPQFIRQITAQLPFAVALVFLGIQDFGPAHQGVDLLLQLLLGPEHPLRAHGLVLGGIGLNLRCHPAPHGSAHIPAF